MSSSSAIEFTVTQEPNHSRTFSRKRCPAWSAISSDLSDRFAPALSPQESLLVLRYVDANGDEASVSTQSEWEGAWDLVQKHYTETDQPFHFALALSSSTPATGDTPTSVDGLRNSIESKEGHMYGSEGEVMLSAFVPKSETEDRASSDASTFALESGVQVSPPASDAGIDIGSREEARESETDPVELVRERSSTQVEQLGSLDTPLPNEGSKPTLAPVAEHPPSRFTPVTEEAPGSAFTPTPEPTPSLSSEFYPVSETADSGDVDVEGVIGSRAALSSVVLSAAAVPLPSDSDSTTTIHGDDGLIFRIVTSLNSQRLSISGSPKVVYDSPTSADSPARLSVLPNDDDADSVIILPKGPPMDTGVQTDSETESNSADSTSVESSDSQSTYYSPVVSGSFFNKTKKFSLVSKEGSNIPDLLSKPNQSQAKKPLVAPVTSEHRAPALPPRPSHPQAKAKLPLLIDTGLHPGTAKLHPRPPGRLSVTQLVDQLRETLADEPMFYYTLKGVLVVHQEVNELRMQQLSKELEPKKSKIALSDEEARVSARPAAPSKRDSTNPWYDAQETDTQTDSDSDDEGFVQPGPRQMRRFNTAPSFKLKKDLRASKLPPTYGPFPHTQRPLAHLDREPIRPSFALKITRPTGEVDPIFPHESRGHKTSSCGSSDRTKKARPDPKLASRPPPTKLYPSSGIPASRSPPTDFDPFIPRSETRMFAETAARVSRLSQTRAPSPLPEPYKLIRSRPLRGLSPLAPRRHTLGPAERHPSEPKVAKKGERRRHTNGAESPAPGLSRSGETKGNTPGIGFGRTSDEWPQSRTIAFDFDNVAA